MKLTPAAFRSLQGSCALCLVTGGAAALWGWAVACVIAGVLLFVDLKVFERRRAQ